MGFRKFNSRAAALAYANTLNDDPSFPVVGKVNGIPAPQNQQTVRYCEGPIDCDDDLVAVPEADDSVFDMLGMGATARANFINTYVTTPGATLAPSITVTGDDSFTNIIGDATAITAKSEQGANTADKATDNTPTTFWRGNTDPQWIQAQFATGQTVVKFMIKARLGTANAPWAIGHPVDFVLQGSNNGSSFTDIRSLTDERFTPGERIRYNIPVANRGSYTYYRLRITESSSDDNVSIAEWRLFV